MALKIDLNKAFDKIGSYVIIEIMARLGVCTMVRFGERVYIFPLFSIIINGKTSHWFQSTCGIRQDDPLSQYLFLFGIMLLDL